MWFVIGIVPIWFGKQHWMTVCKGIAHHFAYRFARVFLLYHIRCLFHIRLINWRLTDANLKPITVVHGVNVQKYRNFSHLFARWQQ